MLIEEEMEHNGRKGGSLYVLIAEGVDHNGREGG